MNEAFRRHFRQSFSLHKQAGVWDKVLKPAFTAPGGTQSVRSGIAQTAGGLAAAAGVSEGEHYLIDRLGLSSPDKNTNLASRIFTHGLNAVLLGLPFGNPRNRLDTFATRNPQTGIPNPGAWDTSKATRSTFLKLIGVPAGAAGINLAAATNDVKNLTGTANQAVTDLADKANKSLGEIQHTTEQISPTVDALRDVIAGPSDVKTPEDAAKAFGEGRNIGIRDYINLAAHKGGDVTGNVDQALNQLKGVTPHLEALGNLARWIPENTPKLMAYGAGGLAAAGGLIGGYGLLRDYLNYRRVEKEREARRTPKVASALDRFHAVNSPSQVAARNAATNSQQAAHYNNVAAGAAQAVAERKAMQQIQTASSPYTAAGNGTLKQDVVKGANGSVTIYDKNGRPVGTNNPAIARPQGATAGTATQSRNPQLGAQIAAQAPGAPITPPTVKPAPIVKPAPVIASTPPVPAPAKTPGPATPPVTTPPAKPIAPPVASATAAPSHPPIAPPPAAAPAAAPAAKPIASATPGIGMPGSPNPFDGVVKPTPISNTDPFAKHFPMNPAPAPQVAAAPKPAPNPNLTGPIPLEEPGAAAPAACGDAELWRPAALCRPHCRRRATCADRAHEKYPR